MTPFHTIVRECGCHERLFFCHAEPHDDSNEVIWNVNAPVTRNTLVQTFAVVRRSGSSNTIFKALKCCRNAYSLSYSSGGDRFNIGRAPI